VRDGGAAQAGRVALERGGEAGEDAGDAFLVLGLGVWVRGGVGVGGVWLFSWLGVWVWVWAWAGG
jgi:hypothetical protein